MLNHDKEWHCLYVGMIEDAYIVPVSISYDKLADGNFIREQMVHNLYVVWFHDVGRLFITGLPTHSVGGQTSDCRHRLSASVALHGGPAGGFSHTG